MLLGNFVGPNWVVGFLFEIYLFGAVPFCVGVRRKAFLRHAWRRSEVPNLLPILTCGCVSGELGVFADGRYRPEGLLILKIVVLVARHAETWVCL